VIRISSEDQTPLRFFAQAERTSIEYYDRYGFVSREALASRQNQRKSNGAFAPEKRFPFKLIVTNSNELNVSVEGDAAVENIGNGKWRIQYGRKIYFLENATLDQTSVAPRLKDDSALKPVIAAILTMGALLILLSKVTLFSKASDQIKSTEASLEAPVIIRPPVEVKAPPPVKTAVDPKAKARQAISQQLGFLGVLGSKQNKKVVGGMPTEAAEKTAGAGEGGNAGSGGELVAGMGRGLYKKTVGNSGVAGLGGIGTKGAGGGAGGYGDTSFGGAGGEILSAVPLAQDAKIDEGLDRSQIQATILRYLSQVRACYEEGLRRNQAMMGQVTMAIEVGGQGQVNHTNVQRSSLNDRPVEDCIKTKITYWKFPQPRGGVTVKVSYPFMLRPTRS
jgi:hypothetical protein